MLMILKLHKYLNWADKKLHSVFFIENKDQITDDLLNDFKEDSTGAVQRGGTAKQSKQKGETKPKGLKQEEAVFVSHNEFLFGRKPGEIDREYVDVNSEADFPTLGAAVPK